MDDGFNGSGTAPGFPQTGEIFISFDFNPDAVRKLLQADGVRTLVIIDMEKSSSR